MRSRSLLSLPLLICLFVSVGCSDAKSQTPLSSLATQVDSGNGDVAEPILLRLHAQEPGNPEVMTQLARIEYLRAVDGLPQRGGMPPLEWNPMHMEAAERWAKLAVEADPGHANAWVVYAQVKYARLELDQSLEMLVRAEALDPSSVKLRLRKGATLRALSEMNGGDRSLLQASAKEFKQAIRGKVDDGNEELAASELAKVLDALGEHAQALDYFTRALGSTKGNSKAFMLDQRARSHLHAGNIDTALADSEAALAILDFGVGQRTLADILLVKVGSTRRDGRAASELQPLYERISATGVPAWESLSRLASEPATFPAVYAFAEPDMQGKPRATNIGEALVESGGFIAASDVQRLHRMGVDFDARSSLFDDTILHRALRKNNVGAVEALLDAGIDPKTLDPSGRTLQEIVLTGTTAERKKIRRLIFSKTGEPEGWKEPTVDLPSPGRWYVADRAIGTSDGAGRALPSGQPVLVQSTDCWFADRTDICLHVLEAPGREFGMIAVPLSKLDDLKALREIPAPTSRDRRKYAQLASRAEETGKAKRVADCIALGTSRPPQGSASEPCSDAFIIESPEDPDGWFVRARILQHHGVEGWREVAHRFIALAEATPDYDRERIRLMRSLLDAPDPMR